MRLSNSGFTPFSLTDRAETTLDARNDSCLHPERAGAISATWYLVTKSGYLRICALRRVCLIDTRGDRHAGSRKGLRASD